MKSAPSIASRRRPGLRCAAWASVLAQACAPADRGSPAAAEQEELRAIAKEAYLYGYPMLANYSTMRAFALDEAGEQFKAPFNRIHSEARVWTPADDTVVTPNADTPYSVFWLDLRAEPVVLSLPAMDGERYFSVQLVDLYTYIVAYLGSRTTGQGPTRALIAGPGWTQEELPAGIDTLVRAETDHVFGIIRTQLFGPEDLPRVASLQAQYALAPLSAHLHQPPPPAPAPIAYPVLPEGWAEDLEFFELLDFLLELTHVHPDERELRRRLSAIGLGGAGALDVQSLPLGTRQALSRGAEEARAELERGLRERLTGTRFGTRAVLGASYLPRALGAKSGLYGNAKEEAFYAGYRFDADGSAHDTGRFDYALRFPPGDLPPVRAFWSVTVYDARTQLLYDNPSERHLINSSMLEELRRDADGGLTIHIQHRSPGAERESNWLPAPDGEMYAVLRLYWPDDRVLNREWEIPALERVAR